MPGPELGEPYQSQSYKFSKIPPRHAASLAMIDDDNCCNLWSSCRRLRKRYVRDLLIQGSILLTQYCRQEGQPRVNLQEESFLEWHANRTVAGRDASRRVEMVLAPQTRADKLLQLTPYKL